MYKVIEVSKLLGVSKVTIYKKMEIFKKELKPHIHKKKNITYLDDEGIEIIKESLIENNVIVDPKVNEEEITKLRDIIMSRNKEIEKLIYQAMDVSNSSTDDMDILIGVLETQINMKKGQLESLDRTLGTFKKINRVNKDRIKYLEEILSEEESN